MALRAFFFKWAFHELTSHQSERRRLAIRLKRSGRKAPSERVWRPWCCSPWRVYCGTSHDKQYTFFCHRMQTQLLKPEERCGCQPKSLHQLNSLSPPPCNCGPPKKLTSTGSRSFTDVHHQMISTNLVYKKLGF